MHLYQKQHDQILNYVRVWNGEAKEKDGNIIEEPGINYSFLASKLKIWFGTYVLHSGSGSQGLIGNVNG